jgi:hypothetical protein
MIIRSLVRPGYALILQTVQGLVRERILYNLLFVSLFLLFVGYLGALLVYGHQDRVMMDFGVMINAFSIFGVAASAGARTVRLEIESRVIYPLISRPLSRVLYYFSRWAGISVFLFLNLVLLVLVLFLGLAATGGAPNAALFQAMGLIWVESVMVVAISTFFSMFFRPGLSVMSTLTVLFIGHNHEQLSYLKQNGGGAGFAWMQNLTPDLGALLLDMRVYYNEPLSGSEFLLRSGYGLGWALMFVLFGNAVFFRKNL